MIDRARKREQLRAWRALNPGKVRASNRRQAKRHGKKIAAYKRRWAAENPRQRTASAADVARARRWNKAHPETVNALTAKRKAAKKQRTPAWLTQAHFAEIEGLYHFAQVMRRLTGRKYHVDHIIPLQGRDVSGLHVPDNLRVIPARENQVKSNRWL